MTKPVFKRIYWTVPNCSKELIEGYQVGNIIKSLSFEVVFGDNVLKWSLKFFPNGIREDCRSYFSLFLQLDKCKSNKFHFIYKFGMKGKTDLDSQMRSEHSMTGEEFNRGSYCGSDKFIPWSELFDPVDRFVSNGTITLICELTIYESKPKTVVKKDFGFETFLEQEFLTDCTLKTKDQKNLKAHKAILASRSRVFHTMLKNDCKETNEGVVEIPDIDERTMKEILRFMYYGAVENLDEIARDLIFAAEKYELDELKEKCIDSLIGSLTTENALEALVLSDRISNAEKLFEKCSEFIIDNYKTVCEFKEWKKLPTDCVKKFMDQMMKRFSASNAINI